MQMAPSCIFRRCVLCHSFANFCPCTPRASTLRAAQPPLGARVTLHLSLLAASQATLATAEKGARTVVSMKVGESEDKFIICSFRCADTTAGRTVHLYLALPLLLPPLGVQVAKCIVVPVRAAIQVPAARNPLPL